MLSNTKSTDFSENLRLIDYIKKDYQNNSKRSFIILLLYRVMHYCYKKNLSILLFICKIIRFLAYFFLRINAQISYEASIGYDIRLPHSADGVVISSYAIIGNHETIYHQVTIGINEKITESSRKVIVRDNCYLSVGCKVISCVVSEGCKIGPNAVCYKDISPNSILVCKSETLVKASDAEKNKYS